MNVKEQVTMMTKMSTPETGDVEIPTDTVASLVGTKFYSPQILKVLPWIKPNYRGKNVSGGRKCIFSQSKSYKERRQVSRLWNWPYARNYELDDPSKDTRKGALQ